MAYISTGRRLVNIVIAEPPLVKRIGFRINRPARHAVKRLCNVLCQVRRHPAGNAVDKLRGFQAVFHGVNLTADGKDLQQVQDRLETSYIKDVQKFDDRAKQNDGEALTQLLNDFSGRQAKRMMKEWDQLDKFLLVKYMDGNIKKEKDGKFERTATGNAAFPSQPHYRQEWQRMIVKDHGDVIREK